jgi:glycosyltransferase involved in cell wall biosynthesis
MSSRDITTVIPTYKRPALLRRAMLSSLEQSGANVTVRVSDNASGDETAAVVDALARRHGRVDYHCHATNIGAIGNFLFGVREIRTPFFSLLSDDDYLLPGFYERALDGLARHPEAMFWAGITLTADAHGTIWDARVARWPRYGLFSPDVGALAMTGGMAPVWTGIVFRREVLDAVGFLDAEAMGPSDLDFVLRIASRYPVLVEQHPSAVLTIHESQYSASESFESFWHGWRRMMRNIADQDDVSPQVRDRLIDALGADARRMLFRKGVNAVASARWEFVDAAAETLATECGNGMRAHALRMAAFACKRIPGMQSVLTRTYRALERRNIRSRDWLQDRYGHLLRRD